MVSVRFRADETSAKLTWMGLTAGVRHQKPAPPPHGWQLVPGSASPRGTSSRIGASLGKQDCCDLPARPSFALPRLHHCYTARERGRSAKPARSLLTELFRPYTPSVR